MVSIRAGKAELQALIRAGLSWCGRGSHIRRGRKPGHSSLILPPSRHLTGRLGQAGRGGQPASVSRRAVKLTSFYGALSAPPASSLGGLGAVWVGERCGMGSGPRAQPGSVNY